MVLLHADVHYIDDFCFVLKEAELDKEGNGWIGAILKGMKRSSPTALKITLRSVRNLGFEIIRFYVLCSWTTLSYIMSNGELQTVPKIMKSHNFCNFFCFIFCDYNLLSSDFDCINIHNLKNILSFLVLAIYIHILMLL